jgi:ankyrin repeat protein
VDTKNNDGETPLSAQGQLPSQVVKEFLEHGADIESKDFEGWVPLHFACSHGHAAVVIELLDHGADIHCACANGHVAVGIAAVDIDAMAERRSTSDELPGRGRYMARMY